MRILQIAEEEKLSQGLTDDINKRLRNALIYDSKEQFSAYNEFVGEEHSNEDDVISNQTDHSVSYGKMTATKDPSDIDEVVHHHDSDTESFYNIWGEEDEWLYSTELRNVVRNLHRGFNKKYNREAKEEKLFELLMSETEKEKKNEETKKNKMKLTKEMFEAGDICKQFKCNKKTKTKLIKQYALLQNDQESMIKRESTPLIDEQNNAVIVWSISDNVFPKLRLDSPEEVRCVEFNPRNGNTVVGGLTNGQICIWDIEGKLETIGSDLSMSEKEKQHKKHLNMHMNWSLDVNFKTRIRPTALSAIIESHERTVTAIQWIHPMTKITSLGKFISTEQGKFSDQFISSSLDGTIKLWDLQPKSMPTHQKTPTNCRFGYPKKLLSNKSPLSVLNNHLKPSYSIKIREPAVEPLNSTTHSPITALSFEIPSMQYRYISDKPLTIGKRQYEYIPIEPSDINRTLVVGTVMGEVGVVTWEGYDTYPRDGSVEECKHIWWKQMHDGPINCIKRNLFVPDIHLVSGGKVVSIWSLKYNNGPIWWKRFHDFTNSILWSSTHPTKFRVSFNNSGVIQFWNFMVHTHQPYYTADIFLKDGLIASLSAPYPQFNYIGADSVMYAKGINNMVNYKKNRIICFSDSAGTVMIMTIRATLLTPDEILETGNLFQEECDWLKGLDAWNERYKKEFGVLGENDVDDHDYKSIQSYDQSHVAESEHIQPVLSRDQIQKAICEETFNWYINRRGPQTRLGKMKDEFLQREKQYMVETMMKKKNVSQQQIDEYYYKIMNKGGNKTEEISIIRSEADKKYRDIINKLLVSDHTEEYKFDAGLKRNTEPEDSNLIFIELQKISMLNIKKEKEKCINHINNNHYRSEKVNWAKVFDFVEKEDKNILNDPNTFKTNFRSIRQKMLERYKNENMKQ
ncbi:unnamed protein product [Aphis gossypii]|uniref:WD repeat-containing protein 63 n=3 Tax=Aphis gossypii TaxID=80765 RepID=A0A9P0NJC5_APHGO|nr:unnamed protein product [Aphis gossypii]